MLDDRIPKQLLCGQLVDGQGRQGGQKKRFKDSLRVTLKSCGVPQNDWEVVAAAVMLQPANTSKGELKKPLQNMLKARRTFALAPAHVNTFICNTCTRTCGST